MGMDSRVGKLRRASTARARLSGLLGLCDVLEGDGALELLAGKHGRLVPAHKDADVGVGFGGHCEEEAFCCLPLADRIGYIVRAVTVGRFRGRPVVVFVGRGGPRGRGVSGVALAGLGKSSIETVPATWFADWRPSRLWVVDCVAIRGDKMLRVCRARRVAGVWCNRRYVEAGSCPDGMLCWWVGGGWMDGWMDAKREDSLVVLVVRLDCSRRAFGIPLSIRYRIANWI
jgi:hypothetical protein